jgi:Zn-dependent peptidase ImmA (M78 family)
VRHGFKARSERISLEARQALGIASIAPLDPYAYAQHKGVRILDFHALSLSPAAIQQLLVNDNESWSGMTLREGEITAILINPSHAPERQRSTLMHELAHFVLNHVPAHVDLSPTGLLLLSEYSEDDESEADWLSGALLLPRDALMHYRKKGYTNQQIAAVYGVSMQMCEWRVRMTGIDVQMRRAGSR